METKRCPREPCMKSPFRKSPVSSGATTPTLRKLSDAAPPTKRHPRPGETLPAPNQKHSAPYSDKARALPASPAQVPSRRGSDRLSIANVALTKAVTSKFLKERSQDKLQSPIGVPQSSTPTAKKKEYEALELPMIPRTSSSHRGNSCSAERLLILALARVSSPNTLIQRHAIREISVYATAWRGMHPHVVATLTNLLLDPVLSADACQVCPAYTPTLIRVPCAGPRSSTSA